MYIVGVKFSHYTLKRTMIVHMERLHSKATKRSFIHNLLKLFRTDILIPAEAALGKKLQNLVQVAIGDA